MELLATASFKNLRANFFPLDVSFYVNLFFRVQLVHTSVSMNKIIGFKVKSAGNDKKKIIGLNFILVYIFLHCERFK